MHTLAYHCITLHVHGRLSSSSHQPRTVSLFPFMLFRCDQLRYSRSKRPFGKNVAGCAIIVIIIVKMAWRKQGRSEIRSAPRPDTDTNDAMKISTSIAAGCRRFVRVDPHASRLFLLDPLPPRRSASVVCAGFLSSPWTVRQVQVTHFDRRHRVERVAFEGFRKESPAKEFD